MDSNTSDANRLHRASMGALLKRLDIPLTLAKKITKSIDEEGLMQQQRNEQSEAAEMIARVQEVIKDIKDEEGSGSTLEDSGSAETKEILNSAAAGLRKRRILSGKDQERQEAWIMKKRFAIESHSLVIVIVTVTAREIICAREIYCFCFFFIKSFYRIKLAYSILCSEGGGALPPRFSSNFCDVSVRHLHWRSSIRRWRNWTNSEMKWRRTCAALWVPHHCYLLHSHVHALIRTVDVPSLTLRWNPGYGHICHVKGKDVDAAHEILKNAKSVSISKSTRSFHLPVQPTHSFTS
jgi:hypothetical protein